jgi:UDP-N-acetylmuramoyl-L-alanyl-D-glutamate--2,6-diaminopimelate ligase
MRLNELVAGIVPEQTLPATSIQGLSLDSRAVQPGDLFAALPGTQVDGARFAAQAVAKGAVAVLAAQGLPGLGVPVVVSPQPRLHLGLIADRFHDHPSGEVAVTGVTGTNGKTTTSFLLAWILGTYGRECSLLGTVTNRVGGQSQTATRTTPHAVALHQALAETRDAGLRDLVMEVSSHALDQHRTAGVDFRCGVFTNLTRDHLDYHGSLQAYGDAKARLFEGLSPDAAAVINARDPFAVQLSQRTQGRVVAYEWSTRAIPEGVEVGAHVLEQGLHGTRLALRLGAEVAPVSLPLVGSFNVENALAAGAAAWALGLPAEAVKAGLETSQGVPGRLERIGTPSDDTPTVLVDYAHTPDALDRVLACLRPMVPGRLLVVFGCGGDRDRGKRALMGRAVARHADQAYLTSDNPRSEDPGAIIAEVLEGIPSVDGVLAIEDREQAIREAVASAQPGDLVVVAGKGHETGQILRDRTIPFDDRHVARNALLARAA